MRFLGDMGLSMTVVKWLRTENHDVVHLREQGLHKLPNGQIFEKAGSENRIVLTFDLDFGEIVAQTERYFTSVVIFRLKNTRSDHVITRLKIVLNEVRPALEKGAIVTVEESRFRVRHFPIGE